MEKGKFYLFACPFYWTWVGRFESQPDFQNLRITDAIYFTYTGATFDLLCSQGLVLSGDHKSRFHGPFPEVLLPANPTVKIPWNAATPWLPGLKKAGR